jgi:hypothetical protein
MKNSRALVVAASAAAVCLLSARAPALPPTVYDVNTTADGADFDLNDGHVDADPVKAGDQITLRAAIQNANRLQTPVQINLPAGKYKLSVKGNLEDACATGDLDITGDVTIVGAGSATTIIDAQNIDRVMQVFKGATATISDVTLTRGRASGQPLGNVVAGGGITSAGTLSLTRCVVSHCRANDDGGGLHLQSGPTLATGATTLVDCYIVSNTAGANGGGIASFQPSVTITNCTIAKNHAAAQEINDAGFDAQGGGIFVGAGFAGTVPTTLLVLTNSTISGNKSFGDGGGVYCFVGAPYTVRLVHCTVAYNTAKLAEGIAMTGFGTMTIANCLLYKNDHNCTGPITSLGGNVELGAQCAFGSGDLNFADSRLAPLKYNGGATPTHALKKKSAAIGAGNPANCVATDQRGEPRKMNCDAGAFETP